MRMSVRWFALAAALAAAPVHAQVIGAPATSVNCFPFTCYNLLDSNTGNPYPSTRYQQVYAASNFVSGPIAINRLSFFLSPSYTAGPLNTGTYTIALSTTTAAVNGLSSTFASNLGADNTIFGVFNLGGSAPSTLTFTGATFNYDPSLGNLLLDVQASITAGSTAASVSTSYYEARYEDAAGAFSRQHNFGTIFDNTGLVTEFGFVQVPEPSSYALLAAGLAVMGLVARRRRPIAWSGAGMTRDSG